MKKASVAGLDESVEQSPQAKPCPKFVNKSNFLLGSIVGTTVKVYYRFCLSNNLLGSFNAHKKRPTLFTFGRSKKLLIALAIPHDGHCPEGIFSVVHPLKIDKKPD